MGYLLKEALKTMCGVNQWCYAVFWKIGCHNPKVLIWEECYYDPVPSPQLQSGEACLAKLGAQCNGPNMGNNIQFLVEKMMMKNQINIIGEGIIGRAAFTGNYQWILSNSYDKNMHPPEVLNEMHHQFSAGIQTVAVIPVIPHGVVQLGSPLLIAENRGFVNDVRSLILQLGCVPSALFSETYAARKGLSNSLVTPGMDLSQNCKVTTPNSMMTDYSKQLRASSLNSRFGNQPYCSLIQHVHMNPRTTASTAQTCHASLPLIESHAYNCQSGASPSAKTSLPLGGRVDAGVVAEVIPCKLDVLNQLNIRHKMDIEAALSESGGCSSSLTQARDAFPEFLAQNLVNSSSSASNSYFGVQMRMNEDGANDLYSAISGQPMMTSTPCSLTSVITPLAVLDSTIFPDGNSSVKLEGFPLSSVGDHTPGNVLLEAFTQLDHLADAKDTDVKSESGKQCLENDAAESLNTLLKVSKKITSVSPKTQHHERSDSESQCTISTNVKYEEASGPHSSGDDLYDIFGVDFKNKLLSGKFSKVATVGLHANSPDMGKEATSSITMQEAASDIYSVSAYLPESSIYSGTSGDHLLEAVVSGAQSASKQCFEEDTSCKTTLIKTSSSAMPSISDQVQPKVFGMPKPILGGGSMAAYSFKSSCSKEGTCSESGSFRGSQISSWVEHAAKQENSVSTACSKRPDDIPKSNRKRLKPGENPRPRPKDRQMIQDRVKELREIVPNGAKCSIDALLERTIKHMLFLQSVTKHADKLKQTGESKLLNREGGLLCKDNFEGGATWAYEVSSQSMMCPIIVEDLSSPRQMLVEMLCEDHGFFLEIADIIRGLGLTILKGVMEARNEKVSARFVVEANRDITRMEVFMSLVHLLDQTVKGSSMPANTIDTNMMAHCSVGQAATIPATGMPSNLP